MESTSLLRHQLKRDFAVAIGCGIGAACIILLTFVLVGYVSDWEAPHLVRAILPTTRFLSSSIMSVTGTILALMLTLLSLGHQVSVKFDADFYRRIKMIAFYNMLVLILSTGFLVLQCIPVHESINVPIWWYKTVYYVFLIFSAILGGALVAIVVMLYEAIRDLIVSLGQKVEEDCA